MNVFLSWSKPKSKELAIATKAFLEGMFRKSIEIWISNEGIKFGEMSLLEINMALRKSEKCLVFLTKDNIKSPWIMYESGAVAVANYQENNTQKTKSSVIPIVFEEIEDKEFEKNPINQFQRLMFTKNNMRNLVKQLNEVMGAFDNEELLKAQFEINWKELNKTVKQILQRDKINVKNDINCQFLVQEFEKNSFPTPVCGQAIKFSSGFETQAFYKVLLDNADKRLWFFGRKNKKLFSTETRNFFSDLKRRQKNGFDFKCLFIDPDCEFIHKAQRGADFKRKLLTCLADAKYVLESNNIDVEKVCKIYSCERCDQIIVIDNVVIFSHIIYDEDDYPRALTQASFYILSIDSSLGRKYYDTFCDVWKSSKKFEIIDSEN